MGKGIKRKIIDFGFEGELKEKLMKGIDQKENAAKEKKAAKAQAKLELEEAKREMNLYNEGNTKKASIFGKFKERFASESTAEDNNGEEWFYDEEEVAYSCIRTTIDKLLDRDKKNFSKSLSGQDLLKRDLEASPLHLNDDENFMRVLDIKWVVPEEDNKEKAFVMLETKYNYFVLDFDVTISF